MMTASLPRHILRLLDTPDGPRLRLAYAQAYEPGKVGPRSKTGDADCSAATSAWKTGRATPETHKQLAKCRAMTKTAKQATLQRAAGNEAKAQALEHRVATKAPLTAKARREEATKRVQERAGRNQARAERQAAASEQVEQARVAAAGEPPPENHEELARQAAVAAIRAHRASPTPETRAAAETAFAHHQEVSGGKDPFAPERPAPIPGSKPGTIGYEPDAFERAQMEYAAQQAAARAQQPRTIKLRRPSPEHRAAVEATAEAIRARGEISRHAEHGPGAVAVKAEEYRRKRADAQKAIGAARAAEPGSFPPRPYRSPLEGRQPEASEGLKGSASTIDRAGQASALRAQRLEAMADPQSEWSQRERRQLDRRAEVQRKEINARRQATRKATEAKIRENLEIGFSLEQARRLAGMRDRKRERGAGLMGTAAPAPPALKVRRTSQPAASIDPSSTVEKHQEGIRSFHRTASGDVYVYSGGQLQQHVKVTGERLYKDRPDLEEGITKVKNRR